MLERRKHPRRDVHITGLIALDRQQRVEACRLMDLSAGGALIAVQQPDTLPDTLTLLFDDPDNPLKVVVAKARIVRREEHHAGLEFIHTDRVMPWRVMTRD